MLRKIRIKGYRGLKDLEIELPAGLPLVLIGENASGKSTILDALSMLCHVAEGKAGRAILNRGGWKAVTWLGAAGDIELQVLFGENSFEQDRGPVEYYVRLGNIRSVPTVLDEEVRVFKRGLDQNPLVVLKGGANGWARNVQTKDKDKNKDPIVPAPSDGTTVLNSVLAGITDASRYPTCVRLKDVLQTIAFYPSFSLGSSPDEAESDSLGARQVEWTRRIKSSGRDLLNALHTLSQEQSQAWTALLTDLHAVFPWCQTLRFPPAPGRGMITLTWTDARSGATLYLDDMSEGMRVYLALLAALHAPDRPALLAFDEPERSLHPRALRRIVKVMESRAESTPLIVATHSDRLLDFLEEPAQVLRITRFSRESGVRIEQVDTAAVEAWLQDYSLSELRARDLLDAPTDEGNAS